MKPILSCPLLVIICVLFFQSCADTAQNTCGQYAVLVPGLGNYSRDIGTYSNQAQEFFDQGLRLTMGYYFPEAISSFLEASCYEKDHPMIYWGLALAIAPNPNSRRSRLPDDPKGEGAKAIQRAVELINSANEVERGLIETLAVRYDIGTYPDVEERDQAYINSCKKLYQKYPDDLEVIFLLVDAIMSYGAWAYWDHQGKPLEGIQEAIDVLNHSMTLDTLHPGNNHLYIHLFESSLQAEKALPQANRLESLMPKAGHVVHMPAHIYLRLGRYDAAIASNQRSIETDDYFLETWGDKPFTKLGSYGLSAEVHRAHALDFIRFASTAQGNYEQSINASRLAAATVPSSNYHMGRAQYFLTVPYFVLKIFGKWDEILAEPMPDSKYPYLEGIMRYTRGGAFIAKDHIDSAKIELNRIKQLISDPILKDVVIRAPTAKTLLGLAATSLEAEILLAEGNTDIAINLFREAVGKQDQLGYMEPPAWSQSMRLYLGDALIQGGNYGEAEQTFTEDLEEFRENGWAFFGLWKALELQNKTEANAIKNRFDNSWKKADIELTHARYR